VELARAVFEATNSRNISGYRALFLTGGEAARVLGREKAEAYLASRTQKVLQDALAATAAAIPQGAIFAGADDLGGDSYAMRLTARADAGEEPRTLSIPIGRAVKVGAVLRLVAPPRPRAASRSQLGR